MISAGGTYAMGRALAHLLNVGSPYAVTFLLLPSNEMHLWSFFTWSTARLKWLVTLSGENTCV